MVSLSAATLFRDLAEDMSYFIIFGVIVLNTVVPGPLIKGQVEHPRVAKVLIGSW